VRIADVRDIRVLDTDLLLVLKTGERIVLTDGALLSVMRPDLVFVFKDGSLRLEQIFQQVDGIEPRANSTDVPLVPIDLENHVALDSEWKWRVV